MHDSFGVLLRYRRTTGDVVADQTIIALDKAVKFGVVIGESELVVVTGRLDQPPGWYTQQGDAGPLPDKGEQHNQRRQRAATPASRRPAIHQDLRHSSK